MATKPSVRTSDFVEVVGLDETMRALRKWDKAVGREAVNIFRDEAKKVQSDAKKLARIAGGPASPSATNWIGRSATGKGAGVKLIAKKGGHRAHATEWGMWKWHQRTWSGHVRGWIQSMLSRRTFRPWRSNKFTLKVGGPGYVIQPAIRRNMPGMEKRVADRLMKLLIREMNKAGVPRGRT